MTLTGHIVGTKGNTGRGIAGITENNDYTITITLTDGSTFTTDPIAGFTALAFDANYDLVVTKTDGTTVTVETDLGDYENLLAGYKSDAEDAKTDAETAQTYAETAKSGADASALKAEQWAKGTKNGTPVTSGDDGYNDNSQYYKEQAASSASSASSSASSAGTDALKSEGYAIGKQNGTDVSSGSTYYHNNAEYYSDEAYGYASDALTSENNAASSESDSRAYAIGKRGNTDVGSSDPAYHNNSKYYAGQASTSATSASGSATSANTDALKAEGYAVGKQNGTDVTSGSTYYENNAKYYAGEAADSATAAAASAASLTVDSALSGSSTNPVQNKVIKGELDNKANIDGYYESLGSGTADQLSSNIFEEDSEPYNFRTSGGSIDIGDRETDMLVGGTVAWNQLLQDFSTNHWTTSVTPSVTITDGEVYVQPASTWNGTQMANVSVIAGHKYFVSVVGRLETSGTNVDIGDGLLGTMTVGTIDTTTNKTIATIATAAATQTSNFNLANRVGVANYYMSKPQLIDLTAMFGSTIADYIYSLEQATAGAGVAWFKKLFPKPYYAYNAGELMSVNTSAHNTVGFNALDPSDYYISAEADYNKAVGATLTKDGTGASASGTNPISVNVTSGWRGATFFSEPLVQGQSYQFTAQMSAPTIANKRVTLYLVDENDKVVANLQNYVGDASDNLVKTITATESGLRVAVHIASTTTQLVTVNNMCLHLVWDGERDGEYEPYVKHSYPLDSSLTLRGIPKLDASNNLCYDGDTYESDGTVGRKYGIKVLNGTEKWTVVTHDPNAFFITVISDAVNSNSKLQIVPSNFTERHDNTSAAQYPSNSIWFIYKQIHINADTTIAPSGLTSEGIAELKSWLSTHPITVVYPLATPTTETADPYTNPQIVDDFGTEEYVDYAYSQGTRDVAIPVGHETQYMANLKAKLEMSPNSPNGAGDYIVRQTNGINEYVQFVPELPTKPSENGTYVLKATVSGGTATLSWESET